MDKLKSILADIVTPLIPLLDMIMSVLNPVFKVLTFLDPLVKAIQLVITSIVDTIGLLFGGNYDATIAGAKDVAASTEVSGEMLGIGGGPSGEGAMGYSYADEGIAMTPQIASIAEKGPEVILNPDRIDNTETNALLKQLVNKDVNVHLENKFVHDSHNDANYYKGPRSREKSDSGIFT